MKCQILVPRPGIELESPALEGGHREVPRSMGRLCFMVFNLLHHCSVVLSVYKSFPSLVNFIPKYFILFGAVVYGLKKFPF